MSSGTAGAAGFVAGAGSDFVAGESLPQPDRKQSAQSAANGRDLRRKPPGVATLRRGCSGLAHKVKDGTAACLLAAGLRQQPVEAFCVDSLIRDLGPPV